MLNAVYQLVSGLVVSVVSLFLLWQGLGYALAGLRWFFDILCSLGNDPKPLLDPTYWRRTLQHRAPGSYIDARLEHPRQHWQAQHISSACQEASNCGKPSPAGRTSLTRGQ